MSSDMIKQMSYAEFLNELKERIRTAQNKAVLSINAELISLYWDIGRRIVESQEKSAWGKGVVKKAPCGCKSVVARAKHRVVPIR